MQQLSRTAYCNDDLPQGLANKMAGGVVSLPFSTAAWNPDDERTPRCTGTMLQTLFFLLAVFSIATVLLPTVPIYAQSMPLSPASFSPADQTLTFAEQLFREGEYFRAITEYRRFLFQHPEDTRQALVHFRIGLAFYRGQNYDEAFATFHEVSQRYTNTPYGNLAWLWQGETLLRQAQYHTAEQVYTAILERLPEDDLAQYARYRRGWTWLYRRQWAEASQEFQQIPSSHLLAPFAQRLAQEVGDGEQLKQKSPLLAGILSGIVPGGGQLYNGRLGDALLSAFLNGLFLFGIVEALDSHEFAIAGVLGLFEAGWYIGNIYGAVNGAHKFNRYTTETFLRNLDNRFPTTAPHTLSALPVGLRLSFRF